MFDTQLFLGLPLTGSYQQELERLDLSERDFFIQGEVSPYLQQIESEGVIYLGKYLGPSVETSSLDFSQTHIYSLLKKLVPDYPYEQHPLLLLAVPCNDA